MEEYFRNQEIRNNSNKLNEGEKLPSIINFSEWDNFNWVDTKLSLGSKYHIIKDAAESLGFKFVGYTPERNAIYTKENILYAFMYKPFATIRYAKVVLNQNL